MRRHVVMGRNRLVSHRRIPPLTRILLTLLVLPALVVPVFAHHGQGGPPSLPARQKRGSDVATKRRSDGGQSLRLFVASSLRRYVASADWRVGPAREQRQPDEQSVVVEGQITHASGAGHQGVTVVVRARTDDSGEGELIAEAIGYGRERSAFNGVAGLEDSGRIVVNLKPERIVHINLVDDLGNRIAGVTVECYDEARDDFRTAFTDASGKVTIRGIHRDARALGVRLTHDDHVSSSGFDRAITISDKEIESTHQLVMDRAGRITGKVTDARTGKPLYGARLITGGGKYSDAFPRGWTDYRGRYTIHGVRPGSTVVTIHLSGYAPELGVVGVKAGETVDLDMSLNPGAVLKGIVKGEGGEPVPGAYVETGRWRGHITLGLCAVTGSDGRFAIESAPHDELEITVGAPRAGRATKTVKAAPDQVIEITLPGAPAGPLTPGMSGPNVGDNAPALALTTLDGKTLNFHDLKGKTILLSFWATWCPPCIEELPRLVKVHEKFAARKDFVMISISRDFDESLLRTFLKRNGKLGWHQVFGDAGGVETAVERYGVTWIPRLFIIGPDGKITAADPDGDDIVKRVERVLKDNDPS